MEVQFIDPDDIPEERWSDEQITTMLRRVAEVGEQIVKESYELADGIEEGMEEEEEHDECMRYGTRLIQIAHALKAVNLTLACWTHHDRMFDLKIKAEASMLDPEKIINPEEGEDAE